MTAAVFAQGATVSGPVDLTVFYDTGRQRADGLAVPSNWTNGTIGFQISQDGGTTYMPLETSAGAAYSLSAVAGTYVPLDEGIFGGVTNFKVTSSVSQANAVNLSVSLVRGDAAGLGSAAGGTSQSGGTTVTTSDTTTARGQQKLTTVNTQKQLTATSTAFQNGLQISAAPGNTGPLTIGASGVNSTVDGTGNGYVLWPGSTIDWAAKDASTVYINGNTNTTDLVSWLGN